MRIIEPLIQVALFCFVAMVANVSQATAQDITLENKAKLVMILKKGVPAADIKAHADKGRLQIAGYVNNDGELQQVKNALKEYLAEEKHQIINNVKIIATKTSLNDKLKLERNVKQHFKQENFPLTDITIQAKSNNIMLSGFVDENIDVAKAGSIAKSAPDVVNVDNFLLYKEK